MARPKRASSLSTTKVTFRLTADEAKQLDELVKELGFKDRSGLVRSWLAQSRSVARGTGESVKPPVEVNTAPVSVTAENNADEMATAASNTQDAALQQAEHMKILSSICRSAVLAIYREADERSGWSRIPNAVRVLLTRTRLTPANAVMIIDGLRDAGIFELSPPNGRYERVRIEDAPLCPRDSRGRVLSRARLTGKGMEFLACILPPKSE